LNASSLIDLWDRRLAGRSAPALLAPDGSVLRTWDGIEAEARLLENRLGAAASPVLLRLPNHPSFPAALLAAWRCRRAVVLVDAGLGASAVEEIARRTGAGVEVSCEREGLCFETLPGGEAPPDGVCLFKVTSGTTSLPQVVPFRAGHLLADCRNICRTMGLTAADRNFGVVAFTHSYGFSNLILPLLCEGIPLVVSNDALPRAVQAGLSQTGATVLPLVPAMFRALLAVEELPATLRLCISAGAPLDAGMAAEFRRKFGRKIHSFYGASECGGICYDGSGDEVAETGFVGRPMDGVRIEEIGEGRIRVFSDAVALEGGVFEPSDLLKESEAGFRIVGRVADVINVAGKKVSPGEVETVLLAMPGVREAVVLGVGRPPHGERVAALVVAEGPLEAEQIRSFCAQHLAGWQVPREVRFVEEIPVNARGKVSRRDLAALF